VCDAVISFVVVVVASEMGMRRKEGRKSRNRNVILDAGIAKKKKKKRFGTVGINNIGSVNATTLVSSPSFYRRRVTKTVGQLRGRNDVISRQR
jgi:hypothetical protein